jgi:hypothetical protein
MTMTHQISGEVPNIKTHALTRGKGGGGEHANMHKN